MVPANGTFEFFVKPGKYNLAVTSNKGCLAEQDLTVAKGARLKLNLRQRPVTTAQLLHRSARIPASSGMNWAAYNCPTCRSYDAPVIMPSQAFVMPMLQPRSAYMLPTYYAAPYPYWGGYSAMSYSNAYFPGVWSGNGIASASYPSGGAGFAAKPNLYIEGPAGTALTVKVDLAPPLNTWLMAVPTHGSKGWTLKTRADGSVATGAAVYPYIFYDLREDTSLLQDERGFCADHDSLIPQMTEGLLEAGYSEREAKDFEEHWAFKIPPLKRFCVYPQDGSALDKVAPLSVSVPAVLTRLQFIVVPREALHGTGKFTTEPQDSYDFKALKKHRAPASGGVVIREWGVGFLQSRPQ
jgi:hypothetical protein